MLYSGKGHLSLMSDSGAGTTVRIAVPYRVTQAEPAAGERVSAGQPA
jgi:hypothetical protein